VGEEKQNTKFGRNTRELCNIEVCCKYFSSRKPQAHEILPYTTLWSQNTVRRWRPNLETIFLQWHKKKYYL